MKKLFIFSALLIVSILAVSGVAFGWGSQGGDGSDYGQLQETAVFYNNSGAKMVHGQAVVLDSTGTAGSTLGAYVTTLKTADSVLVVGVVKSPAADGTPVVVVTKGPIDTLVADSTDAVTTLTAVGTSTTELGAVGGGTNLGIALEAGDSTDGSYLFVWVDPTGAD